MTTPRDVTPPEAFERYAPAPEMDLRPYFDAILAAPDDDAPRLRLADALLAVGDLRGEHIKLSCALEPMALDDPARQRLVDRCAKLPSFSYFTPNPPWHRGWVCRRGFVDEVQWTPAHFIAHGDALMREAPVRTLRIFQCLEGQGAQLAAAPALARLRKLVVPLMQNPTEDLVALGRSPHLAGLHTLRVECLTLDRALLRRLARERAFPGLRALEAINCTVPSDADDEFLRLVETRGLRAVDLTSTRTSTALTTALRARLGDALMPRPVLRGTRPDELRARVRFGALHLASNNINTAGFAAILAGGPYPEVTTLALSGNPIGDAGVEALARSGAFPSLVKLNLDDAGITLAAARILASARGLDHLESVSLGDVARTAPDGGFADEDAAVFELARAASLPSLREVHCRKTWRAYSEGACEETVTRAVVRDDGRAVECQVHHSIWP